MSTLGCGVTRQIGPYECRRIERPTNKTMNISELMDGLNTDELATPPAGVQIIDAHKPVGQQAGFSNGINIKIKIQFNGNL